MSALHRLSLLQTRTKPPLGFPGIVYCGRGTVSPKIMSASKRFKSDHSAPPSPEKPETKESSPEAEPKDKDNGKPDPLESLPIDKRLREMLQSKLNSYLQKIPSLEDFYSLRTTLTEARKNFIFEKLRVLRNQLSDEEGSLANEIWKDAHDPHKNSSITHEANVRISDELCDEEKAFLEKRREKVRKAFAAYIGVPEEDVHIDDVPVIGTAISGGSLRAICANSGSLAAAQKDGLWDCITYTCGLSSGCWLQGLFYSSFIGQDFEALIRHLRGRLDIPTFYPPVLVDALIQDPTDKYLLCGLVEKMRETPNFDVGIVDIFGIYTAYKLFVPPDLSNLNQTDLNLSMQKAYLQDGAHPLPLYAAARHEIPPTRSDPQIPSSVMDGATLRSKEARENESTFQIFEFSPYELYCEELGAGIPSWATGRRFKDGKSVPGDAKTSDGVPVSAPELRMPYLFGLWGSAFCATIARWYSEVRPHLNNLAGLGRLDDIMAKYSHQLGRYQPVDSACVPNYFDGMKEKLPSTAPESIFKSEGLRLTDAGMSNSSPTFPLLRKGRDVDVILALDSSAKIGDCTAFSAIDGLNVQRGLKGWPIGKDWPDKNTTPEQIAETIQSVAAQQNKEAEENLSRSKQEEKNQHIDKVQEGQQDKNEVTSRDFVERPEGETVDYCNVFIGHASERHAPPGHPPPWKFEFDLPRSHASSSQYPTQSPSSPLFMPSQPNPMKTILYMPLLPNPAAPPLQPTRPTGPEAQGPSGEAKKRDVEKKEEADKDSGLLAKAFSFTSSAKSGEEEKEKKPRSIDPQTEKFMSTWNFEYTPEQVDAVAGLARTNFETSQEKIRGVLRGVYEMKKKKRLEGKKGV